MLTRIKSRTLFIDIAEKPLPFRVGDVNASRNILKEGLKIFGQGLSNTKVERKLDFGNKAHSMKPEAPSALAKG